jgi:hypothetical protein
VIVVAKIVPTTRLVDATLDTGQTIVDAAFT